MRWDWVKLDWKVRLAISYPDPLTVLVPRLTLVFEHRIQTELCFPLILFVIVCIKFTIVCLYLSALPEAN